MAHSERMSPVDATWLRMDRPTNLMVILGVMKLAGPVKPAALEKALGERLLAYRRFRQKAEQRPGGVWWVDDRHFDLSRHMHHVRLPGAAGDAELEQFVGELASGGLNGSRPSPRARIPFTDAAISDLADQDSIPVTGGKQQGRRELGQRQGSRLGHG